jgi:hypothetical protein
MDCKESTVMRYLREKSGHRIIVYNIETLRTILFDVKGMELSASAVP